MTDPAPLDAYETAKPDEPTFTLQGGDPLAAELVRLWAYAARGRAGVVRKFSSDALDKLSEIVSDNNIEYDQRECDKLLLRATQAEQVSWEMDSYLKGEASEETVEVKTFDEFERMDIYDIRRRCASAISSFISDLLTYRTTLDKRQFMSEPLSNVIAEAITVLKSIHDEIEIKRGAIR